MALKLYSKYFVDIVFGEGQLGFRIGKNDEDFSVVKGYAEKEDGTRPPLEGCGAVTKGDFVYAINGEKVIFLSPNEVKSKLKTSKRPMTVRFAKPISKSHYKTITTPSGEKKIKKWGDNDDYLPVRTFSINGMNDNFINLRDREAADFALTPIYRNGPLFECEVREYSFNGLPDQKTRSNVWKMLLHSYPYQPSKWEESHQSNISQYQVFANEFIYSKNTALGKEGCHKVPNPLDVSWKREADYNPADDDNSTNESKWSREFGDSEMREIIWKDTQRTYSDLDFFHEYNKDVLARLLYIFGKLNSGIQYVQGMNELLAPLLYVFAEAEGQLTQEVSEEVEADTFFAFNNLMSETRDLFLKQMDSSTSGIRGVLEELRTYVELYNPAVSAHFESLQIDTQFYAMRWLTTLFAREFDLPKTFRIWDSLLADPERFMLMYCVGSAMVKMIDEDLLKSDFAGVMGLLQNYNVNDVDKILEIANDVRIKKLKPEENIEESTSQKVMKASAAIAGEVSDQVKKGWDVMKKKGLPFLSKIAQDTKSKVMTMTENVSQKLAKKEEEKKKKHDDDDDDDDEEKPKKKTKKSLLSSREKKRKESESESEEEKPKKKKQEKKVSDDDDDDDDEGEEDEVAFLYTCLFNQTILYYNDL